jgi:oxygen-independent coproporphyrinogen-3 oxidase
MAEAERERLLEDMARRHRAPSSVRGAPAAPMPREPGEAFAILPHPDAWRASFAMPTWLQALDRLASRPEQALAVGIHLPLCAQRCAYCAHEVVATGDGEAIDRYLDALGIELGLAASFLEGRPELLRLHVGGGTPNLLDDAQLARLARMVETHFRWPADAETSIDCDPRRSSRAQLELLRALGFRHLRFGMADLDPAVQAASGRLQSRALVADAVACAQAAGFDSVQVDLVCGLPGQDATRLAASIEALLAIGPDRIRCLRYLHEPARHPGQRGVPCEAGTLDAEIDAAFRFATRALETGGYHALGDGWFVLDSDDWLAAREAGQLVRWLHGYSSGPAADTLGFGPGRVSDACGVLARNEPLRGEWERRLREGRLPVVAAHHRTASESRQRAAVDHLIAYHELPRALVVDGLEGAWDAIAARTIDGWVLRAPDRLLLTPEGRGRLDQLAQPLLDPALRGDAGA